MKIEKYITSDLKEKGIDLRKLGTNAFAWKYNEISEILKLLEKNQVVILGGDVLDREFSYTYDNWCYDKKDYMGSIQHTKRYIDTYYQRNGDDFYYVLVIDNG